MNNYLQPVYRMLFLLLAMQTALPATANEVSIPIQSAASGGLYIQTILGDGITTEMLLDTGSSYVALSISTFNKITVNTELAFSRNIYGAMANGKVEQYSLYILDKLQISDNCILRNVEVAVLPNANKDILGLNALVLLQPFTLQMTPAILSSQNCAT